MISRPILKHLLQQQLVNYDSLTKEVLADKELVLLALQSPYFKPSLNSIPSQLLQDLEVAKTILLRKTMYSYLIPNTTLKQLCDQPAKILTLLQTKPSVIYYIQGHIESSLLADRDFSLFLLEKGLSLQFLPYHFKDDLDLALIALQRQGGAYKFISDRLAKDAVVIKAALDKGYPVELRPETRDLIKLALQKGTLSPYEAGQLYPNDREMAKLCLEVDGASLRYFGNNLRKNPQLIKLALKTTPDLFNHTDISTELASKDDLLNYQVLGAKNFLLCSKLSLEWQAKFIHQTGGLEVDASLYPYYQEECHGQVRKAFPKTFRGFTDLTIEF